MTPTMEQAKLMTSEGFKLEVRRVIRAPRARVFEAWTNPERIQQWFGGGVRRVQSAATEPHVGGAYRIEMERSCDDLAKAGQPNQTSEPASIAIGNYTEIVTDKKLVFTWNGSWNPTETTLVTIELADVAEGTELKLTHERFLTVESKNGHEQGWTGNVASLAKFCEA